MSGRMRIVRGRIIDPSRALDTVGDVIVEHVLSGRGFGYAFDYYVSLGRKPAESVVAEMAKADATSRNGVVSRPVCVPRRIGSRPAS